MTNRQLEKDLIIDTSMWNLLLKISDDALHVVLYSIVEDNSLILRKFQFDPTATSKLQALENIIYDNPLLLNEFRRIHCVVEPDHTMVIPAEVTDTDDRELIFKAIYPDFRGEIIAEDNGSRNSISLIGIPSELNGFLRRPFHNASVTGHLTSLCRYFTAKSANANNMKMMANIRPGSLDLIVLHGGALLAANTFSFTDPMDAVYYILACRQRLGLDQWSDELLLTGDQTIREAITPRLRTYLSRVMPAIFPPQLFKAGKDAMLAPFDLIVTPLCE